MGIDAEGLAYPVQQFGAKRFTAGQHAAQLDGGMFHLRLTHQLQCRRRQEHVAHGMIGHQLHRGLRFEFFRAMPDHWHAVIPGREQRIEQAADPRPVGRRPHHIAGLWHKIVHHLDVRQMTEHHAMSMQRAFGISCGTRSVNNDRRVIG